MANTTADDDGPQPIATDSVDGNLKVLPDIQNMEESRRQLRCRWELASVLHFLRLFSPVIGKQLRMTGMEIEDALINPNQTLAKLHIDLLKGIPPVHKNLYNPDAWVTILCKKFAEWWPWIAEGKVPLTAKKGEEISRYKELDPINRLRMLKALCELRTEQEDLVFYVNEALKQGTNNSYFQVSKISEDNTGTSFWYDGDSVMGYRLYKEVNKPLLKSKYRGSRACINLPPTCSEWETLATNLDEFHKLSEELSSSADVVEGTVRQTIETVIIPELEKVKKRKEAQLKRRLEVDVMLNDYQPYVSGRTRRTGKPVKYTFEDFDRTIDEAIKATREEVDKPVERNGTNHHKDGKRGSHASNGDLSKDDVMEDVSPGSTDEDAQKIGLQVDDSDTDEDINKNDDPKNIISDTSNSDLEDEKHDRLNCDTLQSQGQKNHVSNMSKRKDSSESSDRHSREPRNTRANNRLRHRPTHN